MSARRLSSGAPARRALLLLQLLLLMAASVATYPTRKLLDTRGLGLSSSRRQSSPGQGFKMHANGEPIVKVDVGDGRGHREMPWGTAYRKAREQGTHQKIGLDPDAGTRGSGKPKGSGYQQHINSHHRSNRRGYYKHMDNLANNPSKIEEWHKRVQRAEALRTKPGQDRNARAHHAAQPGYKGPVILPNRG
mmetsp:Transcript_4676/g.12055  ORF Transcript_4676/g.12055 Transcript_4676/m.12055 type:complete len:191 (-) Transcript_4676:1346-1918(-)